MARLRGTASQLIMYLDDIIEVLKVAPILLVHTNILYAVYNLINMFVATYYMSHFNNGYDVTAYIMLSGTEAHIMLLSVSIVGQVQKMRLKCWHCGDIISCPFPEWVHKVYSSYNSE